MGAEGVVTSERAPGPKVVEITDFDVGDFPIVEGVVNDERGEPYRVIELPKAVQAYFDDGATVVRINSLEIAQKLPDYGGETSGGYDLPPHQDHLDPENDPRRFLLLSKMDDEPRGAATVILTPEAARALVPAAEAYFKEHRLRLGAERAYDPRFRISIEQYNACFDDPAGYERTVQDLMNGSADPKKEVRVRLGLIGYLVRGPSADELVGDHLFEELVQKAPGQFVIEAWEQPGVVAIDNSKAYHLRVVKGSPGKMSASGKRAPLKRNFATVAGS